MRESIDMAVFGAVPAFVRASIRLRGLAPERGAAAARALLRKARPSDDPTTQVGQPTADWRSAYAAVGLPPEVMPPTDILAAWARAPEGVPSQGTLRDLAHAFSLQHGVPVAMYDWAALQGDVWLRPSRGCEDFAGVGDDHQANPPLSELILVDSAEQVLARHWHGRQGRATVVGPATREVLAHLDFLAPAAGEAERLADAFARLVTGFAGGRAEVAWLTWDTPRETWTSGAA